MSNYKIIIFTFIFIFSSINPGLFAQQDMKTRGIDSIMSDIRKEQALKESDRINPDKVSPKLLDELGDAVMDQMIGDPQRHAIMDQMMGGEGSASLTAMHQRIGYNYLTGNIGGYGNMMGYGGGMGYGGMMGGSPYYSPMNNYQYKGSPGYNFMMNRLSGYLNLSKEQNQKIQDINIASEKEISPLRIEILEKQKELYNLWSAQNLDEKAILKASREISEIQSKINDKDVAAQIKIAKILTPGQRNMLPNMGYMNGFPMMYYWNNPDNNK